MEKSPNCTQDCIKYKNCNNHNASLEALILTVGNWSALTNISIDEAIVDILKLLDGVEEGKVPSPEIHCPEDRDLYLLKEGYNLLVERRLAWKQFISGIM